MTTEEIIEKISLWASLYDCVNKIWLFGSTARNKQLTNDIDLAFDVFSETGDENEFTTWTWNKDNFKSELIKLFNCNVDVIFYPDKREWIDKHGILIYERVEL